MHPRPRSRRSGARPGAYDGCGTVACPQSHEEPLTPGMGRWWLPAHAQDIQRRVLQWCRRRWRLDHQSAVGQDDEVNAWKKGVFAVRLERGLTPLSSISEQSLPSLDDSSVSTHRKVSAASSAHSAELPKSCIKTSVSSPNSPPLQHLPGSFPFASTTSHHSRTPSVSPTPSSSLSPFATEPLLACCPTCNETTDLALQLGPAYRIQWTPGAAAKKKRDDLEEQRDILSGLKINCQKWREVLPDEAEQDGYANPLDYDDEVVLSDEEDEAKDRQQQSACRVLSKLDGLSSNCSKHRLNKDWTPDRYYDTQDNEDDLFPMPSPVVSPSPRLLTPISGSPNVSSSNLPGQVTGFFPPATIPGSTSQSLSPSAATAEMTREDSFGGEYPSVRCYLDNLRYRGSCNDVGSFAA